MPRTGPRSSLTECLAPADPEALHQQTSTSTQWSDSSVNANGGDKSIELHNAKSGIAPTLNILAPQLIVRLFPPLLLLRFLVLMRLPTFHLRADATWLVIALVGTILGTVSLCLSDDGDFLGAWSLPITAVGSLIIVGVLWHWAICWAMDHGMDGKDKRGLWSKPADGFRNQCCWWCISPLGSLFTERFSIGDVRITRDKLKPLVANTDDYATEASLDLDHLGKQTEHMHQLFKRQAANAKGYQTLLPQRVMERVQPPRLKELQEKQRTWEQTPPDPRPEDLADVEALGALALQQYLAWKPYAPMTQEERESLTTEAEREKARLAIPSNGHTLHVRYDPKTKQLMLKREPPTDETWLPYGMATGFYVQATDQMLNENMNSAQDIVGDYETALSSIEHVDDNDFSAATWHGVRVNTGEPLHHNEGGVVLQLGGRSAVDSVRISLPQTTDLTLTEQDSGDGEELIGSARDLRGSVADTVGNNHGFTVQRRHTVRYEVAVPRHITVDFNHLLGVTATATERNSELQILQLEELIVLLLQWLVLLFLLQTYVATHYFNAEPAPPLLAWVEAVAPFFWGEIHDWIATPNNSTADADAETMGGGVPMHLAQSEVMIPAMMYVWVSIVRSHEIASLSGSDTLAAERENKWYRKVVWADTTMTRNRIRSERGKMFCLRVLADVYLWLQGVLLALILCLTNLSCDHKSNKSAFQKELRGTDRAVRKTKLEYNLMDSDRRRLEELKRTYLAGVNFEPALVHGPGSYTDYFASVDDAVITADISKLRKEMQVYRMSDASHAEKVITDSGPSQDLSAQSSDISHTSGRMSGSDTDGSAMARGSRSSNRGSDIKPPPAADHRQTAFFVRNVRNVGLFKQQSTSTDKSLQPIKFTDTKKLRRYAHECMMQVADIAQMIIFLSQARRLKHSNRSSTFMFTLALLHACIPIWHAILLPVPLGGGCNGYGWLQKSSINRSWADELGENPFERPIWFACSEHFNQVFVHLLCLGLNTSLGYTILKKLIACKDDYFSRYVQMQYFVQLTPWANLKPHRKKKHWGLLPTFDLSSPANVEAWNKLRLYLQSYKVKSSRILQISVMWCLLGVISVSVYQLVKMTAIRVNNFEPECSAKREQQTCDDQPGCAWDMSKIKPDIDCFLVPYGSESSCNSNTCTWNNSDTVHPCQPKPPQEEKGKDGVNEVFGSQVACFRVTCEVNGADDSHPSRRGLPRNYQECCKLGPDNDISANCEWEPTLGCVRKESHFDTASMFMVIETLIFGSLLLSTLWGGMKSNEIKAELRMWLTEEHLYDAQLLSNSLNFLTERADWGLKRPWRLAERQLHAVTARVWRACEESISSSISEHEHGQNVLRISSESTAGQTIKMTQTLARRTEEEETLARLEQKARQVFLEQQSGQQPSSTQAVSLAEQHHLEQELFLAFISQQGPDSFKWPRAKAREMAHRIVDDGFFIQSVKGKLVEAHRSSQVEFRGSTQSSGSRQATGPANALTSEGQLMQDLYGFTKDELRWLHLNETEISFDDAEDVADESGGSLAHQDGERARTIAMLKVLASVVENEYEAGGRSHWGAEDRRTKMLCISLTRSMLFKILGVVLSYLTTSIVGAVITLLNSGEEDVINDA